MRVRIIDLRRLGHIEGIGKIDRGGKGRRVNDIVRAIGNI